MKKEIFLLVLFGFVGSTVEDEMKSFVALSYNLMFLPKYLSMGKDEMSRARLICKSKLIRSSDVVFLQEMFNEAATKIVLDCLSSSFPYRSGILGSKNDRDLWDESWNSDVLRNPLKFLSAGLVFLSKTSIVTAVEYFFKNSCSGHNFVRVGFIYLKIIYGEHRRFVHLLGTHLQPDDHPACLVEDEETVRNKQLNEIDSFLNRRRIPSNESLLILGDFNIDRHNQQQFQTMTEILRVEKPVLSSSSLNCTWHTSFNAMTHNRHNENQFLDHIFVRAENSTFYNFVIDPISSDQWFLLGKDQNRARKENIPITELSDHYPVFGFFDENSRSWPKSSISVIVYVQIRTVDTNSPIVLSNRFLRRSNSTDQKGATFILTNNGTPRRHRCLKSNQNIFLYDAQRPDFLLSQEKLLRMKFSIDNAHRFVKLIQIDNSTHCVENNSTFVLQSQWEKPSRYVNVDANGNLCFCAEDLSRAQIFRLIEVKRKNLACRVHH